MSGIWGFAFLDREARADASHLDRMARAFDARDAGAAARVLGPIALASRPFPGRLAAAVTSADGSLALAFHGNLYDGRDAAGREDSAAGLDPAALATRLLDRYRERGLDALLESLRGEFAIAIGDARAGALHVACDRFRVHPIFYYRDAAKVVFSSRLQGILGAPTPVSLSIHPDSIVDILSSSIIPTPNTIYREIAKLPPGSVLSVKDGALTVRPYWDVRFDPDRRSSGSALRERLRERLADAVSVRLAADRGARVGSFLSGGIDSSTVTALLARLRGTPAPSFSIGFGEASFNEMHYARVAARSCGSDLHEYFVTPGDVVAALPTLLGAYDEPFANASALPSYVCAKVAREAGIDSLYAGDGGDELFAGNERYSTQRILDYYYDVPAWLREPILAPLVRGLAAGTRLPLFVKGRKFIDRARIPYPDRLAMYGFFSVVPMETILAPDLLRAASGERTFGTMMRRYYHDAPGAVTPLDRQLYVDLKLTISDNDVIKVTRATEAAGVAVRYPFLDHPLAEFAGTVPASRKMAGHRLRTFFKSAYADLLPEETRRKTKHGFGLPIPVWLRTDPALREIMRDAVLSPRSVGRGYFRREALESLVKRHETDRTSFYGTILWNLVVLELWHRRVEAAAA